MHIYSLPVGGTCIHYYIRGLGDGGGKRARIEFAVIIIPHALRLLSAIFLLSLELDCHLH